MPDTVTITRKNTTTTFTVDKGEVTMDVVLDPYGIKPPKLLAFVRLTPRDWSELRNLLNTLPTT